MITFNGNKFAKTESEFTNSLFESDGTCLGYYRKVNGGIKLLDHNKELFAFIVGRKYESFIVSATQKKGEQRPRYMFSTSSIDDTKLGLDKLEYSEIISACKHALKQVS
jgi:hypothetical protein